MNDEILGINRYAAHQHVSPAAVRKAIRSGRIARAAIWKAGRISGIRVDLADQLWREHTDPAQAAKSRRTLPPAPAPKARPAVGVQTSAPLAAPAQTQIGELLGHVFADGLIAWCAMAVRRHELMPAAALDLIQDGLLVMATAARLRLGADPDAFQILLAGNIAAAETPEGRAAVIEAIQRAADALHENIELTSTN
jgi:hypothetical protein